MRYGDTIQLAYVSAGKRFGVIASIDARNIVTLHLPEDGGTAASLRADGETPLAHAFALDDTPGFERFVFVAADSAFASAVVVDALRDARPLPADVTTIELTLEKEP